MTNEHDIYVPGCIKLLLQRFIQWLRTFSLLWFLASFYGAEELRGSE